MATLQTDEANIIDADAVNWRVVVYPALIVLLVVAGGLLFYYYQESARETAESQARAELIKATTPEEFLKVAADYPNTDQALLATMSAANASYAKRDFDGAASAYAKIVNNTALSAVWHDSAQLGIASCDEAKGQADDAINAYLEVARRADQSPFAPYAYNCVARIYDERGDKDTERAILGQAAALNTPSTFTRIAQNKLKELTPAAPSMSFPLTPPGAPAQPAPAQPVPVQTLPVPAVPGK